MLKFRRSKFSVSDLKGNTISKINILGNVTLSGTAYYDFNRKGYFATVNIVPDKKRDLRYFSLYADGSPCETWISGGEIFTTINLEKIPKKFELKWFEDDRDFPNIFRTLVGNIEEVGYRHISRIKSNKLKYTWIYDLQQLATDKVLTVYPKKPLAFYNKLSIFKVVDGKVQGLYSGDTSLNMLNIPIRFDIESLQYENFSIYLNWYDKEGSSIPEVIETEFVQENVPDDNIQIPVVNIDDCYLYYYGKSEYRVETDLVNRKTVIDYNGYLENNYVEIDFKFNGKIPNNVFCKQLRYNNSVIRDIFVLNDENKFSVGITPESFQCDKIDTAILYMVYDFGTIQVEHQVDITKIYRK
mgnify:CR=1 FL=1